MLEPTPNGANGGRDGLGRFAVGNPGGPGGIPRGVRVTLARRLERLERAAEGRPQSCPRCSPPATVPILFLRDRSAVLPCPGCGGPVNERGEALPPCCKVMFDVDPDLMRRGEMPPAVEG